MHTFVPTPFFYSSNNQSTLKHELPKATFKAIAMLTCFPPFNKWVFEPLNRDTQGTGRSSQLGPAEPNHPAPAQAGSRCLRAHPWKPCRATRAHNWSPPTGKQRLGPVRRLTCGWPRAGAISNWPGTGSTALLSVVTYLASSSRVLGLILRSWPQPRPLMLRSSADTRTARWGSRK